MAHANDWNIKCKYTYLRAPCDIWWNIHPDKNTRTYQVFDFITEINCKDEG